MGVLWARVVLFVPQGLSSGQAWAPEGSAPSSTGPRVPLTGLGRFLCGLAHSLVGGEEAKQKRQERQPQLQRCTVFGRDIRARGPAAVRDPAPGGSMEDRHREGSARAQRLESRRLLSSPRSSLFWVRGPRIWRPPWGAEFSPEMGLTLDVVLM